MYSAKDTLAPRGISTLIQTVQQNQRAVTTRDTLDIHHGIGRQTETTGV
jgi:hypothetical protein